VKRALVLLALVACKGKEAPPAPTVSSGSAPIVIDAAAAPPVAKALVDGIKGLCATEDMNPAEVAMAMSDWTASLHAAGNKEFTDVYLAALEGDDAAVAKLRAAADAAVGPGKCTRLDHVVKVARDRAAEIAAMPLPGPASDALVADMKHFCKGPDGLADMSPVSFRELNVLIEKGEYEKARDAVKKAKLKSCPQLEAIIEASQKGSAK
jgi:hypothetical protein